jgi:hypothetical protein
MPSTFSRENLKEGITWKIYALKGGYYIKLIKKKWDVRMWTVSVWLSMGTIGEWAVVSSVMSFQVL